jgi:hypothetical protein
MLGGLFPHSSSRLTEFDDGPRAGSGHPAERYDHQKKFGSS